jgi:hypothetical protein
MLVSLDGNITFDIEKIKNFFSKGKGKTESTPDRIQTAIFKREELSDEEQENFKVNTLNVGKNLKRDEDRNIKKDRKGNNQAYKSGRVAAIAKQETAIRCYYVSEVLSMSSEAKETVNLLEVFVILTLRNLMNYINDETSKNIMKMTKFTAVCICAFCVFFDCGYSVTTHRFCVCIEEL